MTAAQQAPTAPSRTVRLVRPPALDGTGVFCVTVGSQSTYYTVREVACEIGGRGFAVHKLGMGTLYHIRVGEPADCSCECLGFLRHGYCRHLLGLMALAEAGKL